MPLNSGALCATCQLTPPSFRHCISAFHYQPPIDKLILRLKQDPFTAEINQLCAKLALRIVKRYRETQLPFPQTLIPLPLHWLKLARRGFNQSDIIGRHLARHLATEHNIEIELRSDLCKRITHGQAQHLLNAKKRLRSMKKAFAVEQRAIPDLDGLTVAVVDDVVTTGATANSVAVALLRSGAAQVDIWSIARTSWNNSPR